MRDSQAPGSIEWYRHLWDSCLVKLDGKTLWLLEWCEDLIRRHQEQYMEVEAMTGVPYQLVAGIHGLESSFRFDTYLGNGDPLDRPTWHVPAGRGPFASWQAGAIDSLTLEGLSGKYRGYWDLPTMLRDAERFNGLGYLEHHSHQTLSPYIWGCTNHYTMGKYVEDGRFNPQAVSKQVGIAAVFKILGM